ncbi:MAG: glycosyltransferase [Thermosphaera sp.]|nr:glycosyltransferase [Thermosphaera sp.]
MILILKPRIVVVSIPDSHLLLSSYVGNLLVRSRMIIDIRDPQEKLMLISYKKGLSRFVAKAYKLINYSLYKRASAITGTTRTLVEWMAKDIGKQVYLVPNGADLRVFKAIDKREARTKLGLNQGSLLIAYIGLLSSRGYYNILPLLEAIRKIRRKLGIDVKLVVAGPIYDGVVERIINYFKEEMTYMGVLDMKGVVILLSASDIGVIPRVGDAVYDYAIPVKFYEYIATGLPMIVLARKRSELGEVVEKNKLGILCEPQDHICLEKAIKTLATNKDLIDELRKNVLAFKKHVDRRIGAERLLKLIIGLMQDDKLDAQE